jgi:hypothetical protein
LPEEIAVPESATAEIILFPTRAAAKPVAKVQFEPTPAEARLSRALAGLNNAVTTQRAAMAAWKSALGDLRTVTGRLGDSLKTYNDSLGHLDARVQTLRAEAVKLEAWADGVLAKKV